MNANLNKLVAINDTVTAAHAKRAWNAFCKAMEAQQEFNIFTSAMETLADMDNESFGLVSSLAKDENPTLIPWGHEDFSSLWSIWDDIGYGYIHKKDESNPYDSIPEDELEIYAPQPRHAKAHSARNKRRAHLIKDTRKHGLLKRYHSWCFGHNDSYNRKHNFLRYRWLDIELSSI